MSRVHIQLICLFSTAVLTESLQLNTLRYDTRCYFNVRSKADISQLNLPHGTNDQKLGGEEKKLQTKNG